MTRTPVGGEERRRCSRCHFACIEPIAIRVVIRNEPTTPPSTTMMPSASDRCSPARAAPTLVVTHRRSVAPRHDSQVFEV